MTSAKVRYSGLFSPISLGPVTLPHRVIMTGHNMLLGNSLEGISSRQQQYLISRARGGAAMVGFESAAVHESTHASPATIPLYSDHIISSLTETAEKVHDAGARLSMILWHGGRNISHLNGAPAFSPTSIPDIHTGAATKAITQSEIRELVKAFGSAAKRCARAGVDVVEIQAGLDYLLGSFLNPTLNKRTDLYGGSARNRARFLVEVLSEIRHNSSNTLAVGVRMSTAHLINGDPNDYELENALEIGKILTEQNLVDYVSLVTGSYLSLDRAIPPMHIPRVYLAEQAKAFRSELDIPIVVTGRIRSPDDAEQVIEKGIADVVGMARSWIAEPDWIRKILNGNEERIRPCMSCNQACIGFIHRGRPGSCVINPSAGREKKIGSVGVAETTKNIYVIGGGPAGLEVARVAAERGHQVSLFESSSRLGGQMRLAAESRQSNEMLAPLNWWEAELKLLGVTIHLGHTISPQDKISADIVIWAIGSQASGSSIRRFRPFLFDSIPGTDGLPYSREVLANKVSPYGRVLIIDEESGWPAVSVTRKVANLENVKSLMVTTTDRALLGESVITHTLETGHVSQLLDDDKISIRYQTAIAKVDGDYAYTITNEKLGPFNTIILSTGTSSRQIPEAAIAVGDCVAPRDIWSAVNDAYSLARTI